MAELKTNADKLLELVEERKEIGVKEAAKLLGLDSETVQSLAELLEDSGLLSIKYGLTGETLMGRSQKPKVEETPKNEKKVAKILPKDPLELAKFRMKTILVELQNDEKTIAKIKDEIDKIFKERNEIISMIERLKREQKELKQELSGLFRRAELLKAIPGDKNKKLKEINAQIIKIYKKRSTVESEIRALKKLIKI